jgi:carboxyl-terminal processing protease
LRSIFIVFATLTPLLADMSPQERGVQLESFEHVWTTIRDKHWDPRPGGLDWQKVHDELRPKAEKAKDASEIRGYIHDMLARLKQSHFKLITYADLKDLDLDNAAWGVGEAGFEARVLGDKAYVVKVEPGVPVSMGWEIRKIRGVELAKSIRAVDAVYKDTNYRDLRQTSMLQSKLMGAPGTGMPVEFVDAQGAAVARTILLRQPRGNAVPFGNLPAAPVWLETRKIGNTGYIRFNLFLDPMRISTQIGLFATDACAQCDGIVVDVRGNPGGIGIMAAGVAGWFVSKPNTKLGTMHMRDSKLNFIVNPRPRTFQGPVAVLIDGASASTAEIFAGGMQDLKRARVFGTKSAAAALPSIVERLPNGDGFQYAVANYISESGRTLEANGVIPDEEVRLTRENLLTGKDAVVEAALAWIQKGMIRKGIRK